MDKDSIINMDPNILLSLINTKLRDEFKNLKDLISTYDLDEKVIVEKLMNIGYKYNESKNQFL
ncbi:hypothetical protein K144313037_00200 [Clostridium tetani]|uniref:DUF4250 domain-containing protein n=1 Tax=Clostridium tetani TaxID=1513 RepID=UPI0003057F42|nr:DUF4250 domain-containing protein [Clostridium tetani]RXI43682.1 DUF4250 domain-containing protein [Clostridium tetani]RXI49644.1 DUF4250 domain-containing protein [Clostridium tetani]RXI54831.1 DUF4250 domain-containing protein [Clostridium tetani]RXI57612.1 DUF4250 domain-containing protein [Clostridium tetani]